MKYSRCSEQSHLRRSGLTIVGIAAVFALSACSGKAFLQTWTVENVFQDEVVSSLDPLPMNPGGTFTVERGSGDTFKIVPGKNFSQFDDDWAALEFKLLCGKGEDDPISIQDLIKRQKTIQREAKHYPPEDVFVIDKKEINDLYNKLTLADAESLVAQGLRIHPDEKKLPDGKETHFVHLFIVQNADEPESYKKDSFDEDLFIFFCHETHCNHNGMGHADSD